MKIDETIQREQNPLFLCYNSLGVPKSSGGEDDASEERCQRYSKETDSDC